MLSRIRGRQLRLPYLSGLVRPSGVRTERVPWREPRQCAAVLRQNIDGDEAVRLQTKPDSFGCGLFRCGYGQPTRYRSTKRCQTSHAAVVDGTRHRNGRSGLRADRPCSSGRLRNRAFPVVAALRRDGWYARLRDRLTDLMRTNPRSSQTGGFVAGTYRAQCRFSSDRVGQLSP